MARNDMIVDHPAALTAFPVGTDALYRKSAGV